MQHSKVPAMTPRKWIAVVTALGLLAFAAPAISAGPSPVRIAKKALKLGKKNSRAIKRSYNRTHPTEVRIIDSADVTAQPFDVAEFDVTCPSGEVAVTANLALGALEPIFVGSYGNGVLVSMFNPSDTTPFSGSIQAVCVWAGDASSGLALAARAPSREAALDQMRAAEKAALR